MKQTIRLLDYKDKEKTFIINDFEKVKELIFQILSGDGVLTLVYQDGKTKELDSNDNRFIDFDDGIWVLEPKDIEIINNMKDHYDTDRLTEVEESYGD